MQYLEYTNIVLQAVNEGPLTQQQFSGARGLQQFAKEAVNRSYFDIAAEFKWPWLQSSDLSLGTPELSGEKSLVPTDTWSAIPVVNPYRDAIDWSTVYYRDQEENKQYLKHLSWEQYEDNQEYYDNASNTKYIVESADGRSMGLIPFPETPGTLYYRIWARPSRFNLYNDEVPLPDMHFATLIDGALHHMWSFRSDVDQAKLAYQRYDQGIKRMKKMYTNQTSRLRVV